MKVAEEAWVSTALLHTESPQREDFTVKEIKERARREGWLLRQGFYQHVSSHCVANKPADPVNHRMLYQDSRGRKRLFRQGDPCHPDREHGKVRPEKHDLPQPYQDLIDWYDSVYSRQSSPDSASGPRTRVVIAQRTKRDAMPSLQAPEDLLASGAAFVSSAGSFVIPEYLRRELGIREGTRLGIYRERDRLVLQPVTEQYIDSLIGCCKGGPSMVETREREHRLEK